MQEQSKFLEILEEIKLIAASQQNKLTREEIKKYLSDMELDADKLDAVYHYLSAAGIKVDGYKFVPNIADMKAMAGKGGSEEPAEGADSSASAGKTAKIRGSNVKKKESGKKTGTSGKESPENERAEFNRRIYRREVNGLDVPDSESVNKIVEDFLKGDKNARDKLIESRLSYVMKLASGYKKRDAVVKKTVTLDDVTAEGNMGLLLGISMIEQNTGKYYTDDGKVNYEAVHGTINMEIVSAMENMIDSASENKDWEDAVLAKTNLLHEAAKFMTEETGRLPSREELAEYTKLSVEEINNIMGLSEDAGRVAR